MSDRRFSEAAIRRILGRAISVDGSNSYSEHDVLSAAHDVGIRREAVDAAIAEERLTSSPTTEGSTLAASLVLYGAAGFGVGTAVNVSWWTPMEASSALQIGVLSLSAVTAVAVATVRGRSKQIAFHIRNATLWGSFGVVAAAANSSPGIPFLSLSGIALGFGVISALVGGAALLVIDGTRRTSPVRNESSAG